MSKHLFSIRHLAYERTKPGNHSPQVGRGVTARGPEPRLPHSSRAAVRPEADVSGSLTSSWGAGSPKDLGWKIQRESRRGLVPAFPLPQATKGGMLGGVPHGVSMETDGCGGKMREDTGAALGAQVQGLLREKGVGLLTLRIAEGPKSGIWAWGMLCGGH